MLGMTRWHSVDESLIVQRHIDSGSHPLQRRVHSRRTHIQGVTGQSEIPPPA